MSYAQQAAAPQAPATPSAAQIREEVAQTIRASQDAARDAQRAQEQTGRGDGRFIRMGPGAIGPGQRGGGFTLDDGRGGRGGGGIPPQAVDIALGFFAMCVVIVIGWPIARAFGKRLERKGEAAMPAPAMADQLHRIEQAVEAMSIEVERISESQRFIARLEHERLPQAVDRT